VNRESYLFSVSENGVVCELYCKIIGIGWEKLVYCQRDAGVVISTSGTLALAFCGLCDIPLRALRETINGKSKHRGINIPPLRFHSTDETFSYSPVVVLPADAGVEWSTSGTLALA